MTNVGCVCFASHNDQSVLSLVGWRNVSDSSAAPARNDDVLEPIYIGRTFRNDTERLEKLFDLYTKMTAKAAATPARKTAARKQAST